jgi:hypothetical protein
MSHKPGNLSDRFDALTFDQYHTVLEWFPSKTVNEGSTHKGLDLSLALQHDHGKKEEKCLFHTICFD